MKILFLAPHPFYQERGTPIAVDLLLRVLSKRGHQVHVLTFHEGSNVDYPNVYINRIRRPPGCSNIRPGFSFKKLVCDFFLFLRALRLRRRLRPDLIHAVEESAFMASLGSTPFVYDMDSCLSQQLKETSGIAALCAPLATRLEKRAISRSQVVIAVCPALATFAKANRARKVYLLPDISLLSSNDTKDVLGDIKLHSICFMYIGNLQAYQGIDLLVHAFHLALQKNKKIHLLVIGGTKIEIESFRKVLQKLGIQDHVTFAGPRPMLHLASMLDRADIVVSPRIRGINTPMKIYSYLDSGKPLLATRLPTHTQVLTDKVACLAEPTPEAFAKAILNLADNEDLRKRYGVMGKEFAQRFHNFTAFEKRVGQIYGYLEEEIDVRR